ncbi:MAG: bifunctional (p)ppGpp synthetase/guanosine-3',5'-bis(diphosphate) 3'-pyrophosphohydrolase [Micavibrio sp.]|nr:bifunctional (p)ppGpp synthetase/guanosine-3',5'-bis(diphosphate) 3'-pyrophosphohydrolase [Micavibrio sp.]
MIPVEELLAKIKTYNPEVDEKIIREAYEYGKEKHAPQIRSSGEPYFSHPIEVACIMTEMRLDTASIITALLHDTVEDTDATYKEIEEKFGKDIALLVDGVTKLTRIESQTVEGKQAENFRKLVLAMSEDIRVLLVKLADRLHNMRTLHFVKDEKKRKRIARETTDIYTPLAERIGIHRMKEELEDLAFEHMNPEARESITNRLSFLRQEGTDLVKRIIVALEKDLKDNNIKGHATGREKTRFSIWKKMQRKNVSFEQLSDIMAFRIVVDDIAGCYQVLGIMHGAYHTIPGRFKDYISTPKPNGYRSIHTTIIGPENQRIEIQIRTKEMHEEADLGVAAHWGYKGGENVNTKDIKKFRWLRELLDIIEQDQKPEDFLENTKLELFQDQVYCFSPKGDLIELPNGATPVDFAYAIHSGVGDITVGAKVNGRIVPLNSKLQNGDQVEIQTSKNQTPSPTWERFVVTGKAKSHIRRFIRQQQRGEYVILGRAMLQKIHREEEEDYVEKNLNTLLKKFNMENAEDILAGIGQGNITTRDVFRALHPNHATKPNATESNDKTLENLQRSTAKQAKTSNSSMPILGLIPGMAMHYGRCCHPLPGDRIVGIVTTGKGVTIHTIDCDTLESFADTPERWLDVSWGDGPNSPESQVGRLNITVSNEPGVLGTLSNIITSHEGNITNLKITHRTSDFWDMYLDVHVNDIRQLNDIMGALRASGSITKVERAKG